MHLTYDSVLEDLTGAAMQLRQASSDVNRVRRNYYSLRLKGQNRATLDELAAQLRQIAQKLEDLTIASPAAAGRGARDVV